MADIVARLRAYAADDHERGCQGREYTCACGYDDKRDPLLAEAADTITALRAENARLRAALRKINVGDGWAAQIARTALAGGQHE